MAWLLSLFQAHRQIQRELDDAKREAGHWRSEAAKWEDRCETARRELVAELRGEPTVDHGQPGVESPRIANAALVDLDAPLEPPRPRGKVHARELVHRQERLFLAQQIEKTRSVS